MKLYLLHNFVLRKMALLAFLFSYGLTFSQNTDKTEPYLAKANRLNQEQSLVFMQNKVNVTDKDGNSRPDILFSARMGFLSKKGIHYQFQKNIFSKKDKREKINEQNEIPEIEKSETYHFSIELQNTHSDATIIKKKMPIRKIFIRQYIRTGLLVGGTYNRIANGQYLKYAYRE